MRVEKKFRSFFGGRTLESEDDHGAEKKREKKSGH